MSANPVRAAREYVTFPIKRVKVRARLLRPWRRWKFARFGARSIVHRPDWVFGAHKIQIGDDVLVLHGVWLSAEKPSWESDGPAIVIGDRVGIRPYCTISAHESVVIEDDVIIAAFSSVMDSDHSFDGDGDDNVMHNPVRVSPVRIGRGTWIGERCTILRGARIGERCIIGANSVVKGEIPDGSIAVGAPARVVGRTPPRPVSPPA